VLCSIDDALRHPSPDLSLSHFQGMIGENLLSLVLNELVHRAKKHALSAEYATVSCNVIRADENHLGKEFAFQWNNTKRQRLGDSPALESAVACSKNPPLRRGASKPRALARG